MCGTVSELENCCSYIPSTYFWQIVMKRAMKYSFWLHGMHFCSTRIDVACLCKTMCTFNAITKQHIPKGVLPRKRTWVGLVECWSYSHAIPKCNSIHSKSRNNPNLKAKYKQVPNKVVSQLQNHMWVSIPTGNFQTVLQISQLLDGKRASAIPVINHDEIRIACDE